MLKRLMKFAIAIGVLVIVVLLALTIKVAFDTEAAIKRMPVFVMTPGGLGAGPNYYCERIDSKKRIAYNCIPSGKVAIVVYPEYHLSASDSWIQR